MTTWKRSSCLALCLVIASVVAAAAGEGRATVREYRKVFRTYPFSDPNPIPQPGRVYPYFRFDGYTDQPVDREWTVVELENDYLRVTILPEIGGKIWSAVEKSTGRSFIYDNHVVKFRDVALRGPWTSGGIEPNYGIIGHTPNCATPVDYTTRTTREGAEVVIGVLDLLTRTPWCLVITLPHDKAYFTTRSIWHNATPIEQPYYSWMNTGIKAAGNLELVYPGTNYIGHGGEVFPWPMNPENGKNLAFYEQNDFGSYKSYHVVGRETDFFGAYWHDDDFGMGHYARRDDKLGKKAWIWGLSRQGMIWEQQLTDTDGQYVEVQSGRLFNQAAEPSTFTPFKHRGFEPYSTDTWTEYWFPVKGTGGYVKANEHGALNVVLPGTVRPGVGKGAAPVKAVALELRFSPLESVNDTLEVLQGDKVVYTARLELKPMQTWAQSLDLRIPAEHLRVRIGNLIDYRPAADDELSRPLESPKDFDWTSVQGLHIQGKEWMRQREYAQAQTALEACLKKDPNYLPALSDLAILRYRAMDYQGAWDLARRGLAIDTYDPASNYYYGLASVRLGRTADAIDGFEVAAQSPEFRVAAWTELARLFLSKGDARSAGDYAARSVAADPMNVGGLDVLAVAGRVRGQSAEAAAAVARMAELNPLDHFARAEAYLAAGDPQAGRPLVAGVRNELPHETFLELAAWYRDIGRIDDARRVLELAPPQDEVLYWLAFVQDALHDPAAAETLRRADAASARLVFPFRSESASVFEWAMNRTTNWRPRYYRSLIFWGLGDPKRALDLLTECGDAPDFAPLFAARAALEAGGARDRSLADLRRAASLEPVEWRYGRLLTERFIEVRAFDQALTTAARYAAAAPENSILSLLHVRALLLSRNFVEASGVLARLNVLPHEGATESRFLYREAELMVAVADMKAGRFDAALRRIAAAREWPEHLGVGKPYPADTDERLEDYLAAQCLEKQGKTAESNTLLEKLAMTGRARPGAGRVVAALAAESLGRPSDAERVLTAWLDDHPDPRIVAWVRQALSGQHAPWPPDAPSTGEWRVLAEWVGR
jgi:tetratricopeptide (TPR) repeat protein